jgi:hypothetical protein
MTEEDYIFSEVYQELEEPEREVFDAVRENLEINFDDINLHNGFGQLLTP